MQIKKKTLALSAYLVLVALVVGFFAVTYLKSDKVWNDPSTWVTEQKLTLPKVADKLNVKLVGEIGKGDFTFTTQYCVLYSIVADENNATLKCSMLPYYYTTRQGEVPKDWSEKSDIALVISKNDAAPTDFLGRQDTSFTSVSSLGSEVQPVSLTVTGKATKPSATIINKLEHLRKVYSGEKEQLRVSLASYSISKLSATTDEQKAKYAEAWKKSAYSELNQYTKTSELKGLTANLYLDKMRDALTFERVKCEKLGTCEYQYERNAAEKFLYMVYGWETSDKSAYATAQEAMLSALYPFSETRKGSVGTPACATCSPDWTELSAYIFSVCPINDVVKGTSSMNTTLFKNYVSRFLTQSLPIPTSEKAAIALIDEKSKLSDFIRDGGFDRDYIDSVNLGCYYLLTKGVDNNQALKNKVIDTYFAMLSTSIGKRVEPTTKSINNLIFETTAYSPYKTSYIADYTISKYREQSIEKSNVAAENYVEWRSLLHTAVLLYLTNISY